MRVSRVGFGVSPKQAFRKVREPETASPTRETRALPRRNSFARHRLKTRQQRVTGDQLLLPSREILHRDLRPFIAEEDRDASAELLRGLELFADLCGRERVIDAIAAIAQRLDLRQRIEPALFLRDDGVYVELALGGNRFFHL